MAVTQQERKPDANVVSSHGYVVDNSQEYTPPAASSETAGKAASAPGEGEQQKPTDGGSAPAPAGEQKAGGEAAAGEAKPDAAQPAESAPAAGPDLNAVLQEIMGLKQALANPQQPGQEQADPLAEVNAALATLEEQARNGEISQEELTMKTIPLIERRVEINMERKMQQDAQAKSVSDAQGAFIAQNPDFVSFAQSPEAAAMINSNPVLDNVSAYYAAKYMQATEQAKTLQAQIQELQMKQAQAIKNAGAEQATIVSGDTGTEAGADKTFRGDGKSPQEGGLAALRRVRTQ